MRNTIRRKEGKCEEERNEANAERALKTFGVKFVQYTITLHLSLSLCALLYILHIVIICFCMNTFSLRFATHFSFCRTRFSYGDCLSESVSQIVLVFCFGSSICTRQWNGMIWFFLSNDAFWIIQSKWQQHICMCMCVSSRQWQSTNNRFGSIQ